MRIGDYKLSDNAIHVVLSGKVSLTADFHIEKYDENAQEFFGGNLNAIFFDIAPDEAKDELKIFLEELPQNKEDRIITYLMDRNECKHLVDIRGTHSGDSKEGASLLFYDLDTFRPIALHSIDNMNKYRAMLGMVNGIYFDVKYDSPTESEYISFYRYVGQKSTRLYYEKWDTFLNDMIKYGEDTEKNIANCKALFEAIKNSSSSISTNIVSGFLNKEHNLQKLKVKANLIDNYGKKILLGYIDSKNDYTDDLPYYMTDMGIDSMTGLLNKKALVDYTEDSLSNPATSNRKHYVMLLDIDDFKQINDNYGHQIGDKAIQILASTLSEVMGENAIVGRYGGDEFYIMTTKIYDEETVRSLLRLVRANVANKAKEQLGIDKLTLSIGVALYPDVGKTYTELLSIADKCLYIAKEKGKNRYIIYRPTMHENIQVGAARRSSTYNEESKAISIALKHLYKGEYDAVSKALSAIIKGFDIDNIDVYYGTDFCNHITAGKYSSVFEVKDFLDDTEYMDQFNVEGQYIMNNYTSIRRTHPNRFADFEKKQCMSLLQLALPTPDEPKYFISFNLYNHIHKWSDAEINYLTLFGSLLFEYQLKNVVS